MVIHILDGSNSTDFTGLYTEIIFLLWLYSMWENVENMLAQNSAERMLNQPSEAIKSGNAYGQKPIHP